MSEDESRDEQARRDELTARVALLAEAGEGRRTLLPGLICIGLYMLVLAAVVTLGVVGGHYPPLFLLLAAMFVTASFGLIRLFRWAWALTLAAVFLLMSYYLWLWSHGQMPGEVALVQSGLDLLLFLYLVRSDVRSRLR
jgi:hypothetical protein